MNEMPLEIERTYLVHRDRLPVLPAEPAWTSEQYYLSNRPPVVRVWRHVAASGAQTCIDVKGPGTLTRVELGPYLIPEGEFTRLASLTPWGMVEKMLYLFPVPESDLRWELHVFRGKNAGLLLAEIEVHTEEDRYKAPSWIAADVTEDGRFSNVHLAERPFVTWPVEWRTAVQRGEVPPV